MPTINIKDGGKRAILRRNRINTQGRRPGKREGGEGLQGLMGKRVTNVPRQCKPETTSRKYKIGQIPLSSGKRRTLEDERRGKKGNKMKRKVRGFTGSGLEN